MRKLKHTLCIMLTLILTLTSIMVIPVSAEADGDTIITVPITVQEEYSMANEFFQIMNQKRVEAGLPEYKLDTGLMDMAMTRAAQLCIYFDHASLTSDPRKHDALGDLQIGTPIEQALRVVENIADGTGDATSTYNAWYGSNGHKLALISDKFYYCGIGAVTYHNNIKWCLIVSDTPCGNEIDSVSGSKTNTRNIDAKAKFFSQNIYWTINANANSSKCGADGYMNESFTFADIGTQSTSYYVTQPGVFTFRSNNPELFSVDGIGRIKPLKSGTGSLTVLYKGMELCTTPVKTTELPQRQLQIQEKPILLPQLQRIQIRLNRWHPRVTRMQEIRKLRASQQNRHSRKHPLLPLRKQQCPRQNRLRSQTIPSKREQN